MQALRLFPSSLQVLCFTMSCLIDSCHFSAVVDLAVLGSSFLRVACGERTVLVTVQSGCLLFLCILPAVAPDLPNVILGADCFALLREYHILAGELPPVCSTFGLGCWFFHSQRYFPDTFF